MEQIANNSIKTVSQEIIGALADAMDVDFQTVRRWFQKKDIKLTTDKAKEVFVRKGVEWTGDELVTK